VQAEMIVGHGSHDRPPKPQTARLTVVTRHHPLGDTVAGVAIYLFAPESP
jgi:hypothetical protein